MEWSAIMNIGPVPSGRRPQRSRGVRYERRYFRPAQSAWGQVQKLGIRRIRATAAEFRLRAHMLSALEYLSIEYVAEGLWAIETQFADDAQRTSRTQ